MHVLAAFLETAVLSDGGEVVSVGDSGLLHPHLGHYIRQNLLSDGHMTRKGAFLVNIGALSGLLCVLKPRPMWLKYRRSSSPVSPSGPLFFSKMVSCFW